MDKIEKALARLSEKERQQLRIILSTLKNNRSFVGLDVKKLKGRDDIFRIRKGKLRIIFRSLRGEIFILSIERRSDNTYNL